MIATLITLVVFAGVFGLGHALFAEWLDGGDE